MSLRLRRGEGRGERGEGRVKDSEFIFVAGSTWKAKDACVTP